MSYFEAVVETTPLNPTPPRLPPGMPPLLHAPDKPGAWVARVTANLAIDARRRDRTAREAVLDLRPPDGRETTLADRVDLAAALQLLSKRQRELSRLRRCDAGVGSHADAPAR